jgi:hypothetical protein
MANNDEQQLCEDVVCDLHVTDMRFVHVRHGMGLMTKALDGFACTASGCNRFFGTEGYCDLTKDSEFINVRTEPSCSSQHKSERMYIQRKSGRLHWICPVCNSTKPHDKDVIDAAER